MRGARDRGREIMMERQQARLKESKMQKKPSERLGGGEGGVANRILYSSQTPVSDTGAQHTFFPVPFLVQRKSVLWFVQGHASCQDRTCCPIRKKRVKMHSEITGVG